MTTPYSLAKDKIKILLLEGVHQSAVECLRQHGYTHIQQVGSALTGPELHEAIADVHFVGIRSRTQITTEVLQHARRLIGIGCFCIGTNQVDQEAAKQAGIPVFNAPFSNTRSVAELVLAEIIMLLRRIPEKNMAAHRGQWRKTAKGAHEARGKTLGIVGYGHIGTQLGVLAEQLGMRVIFYDVATKLALGNAQAMPSLPALLKTADILSLHVPETRQTQNLIGAGELALMKPQSILINASRGQVVDLPALAKKLSSQELAGAAIDVFPSEPKNNEEEFLSPLRGLDNAILTPHVGGSTQEAQENIGTEVAEKLARYSDNGSTLSAVNFPEVNLPAQQGVSRLLHIHENRPGVLTQINQLCATAGINIAAQYLQTDSEVGYVVMDINSNGAPELQKQLKTIPGTIRCRMLYNAQ